MSVIKEKITDQVRLELEEALKPFSWKVASREIQNEMKAIVLKILKKHVDPFIPIPKVNLTVDALGMISITIERERQ